MVTWQRAPQAQVTVTHSAVDYIIDALSITNSRRENGFDIGSVIIEDTDAKHYVDHVAADDVITIKQKDASDASWITILKGRIRRVEPILSSQGNLLKLACDGAGYGLGDLLCGEEYGTESANSTLDTIREMVKDASNGIVPKWVNNLLGTATATGHSYTTFVEDIAGSMRYLYFTYKPAYKAINDVCDVVQAIKGASAGPHWIVDTSDRFLLTTVGAHSAAGDNPAQHWPTWWRTDQAGSTLEEGKDFLNFRFQDLAKEANYVLYHGKVIKPLDLDKYTQNNAADYENNGKVTEADDASGKVGAAIKFTSANYAGPGSNLGQSRYPDTDDLDLNITNMGGKYDVPVFHAWAKIDANFYGMNGVFYFTFIDSTDEYFGIGHLSNNLMFTAANQWTEFTIPIGPYWMYATSGIPSWFEAPFIGVMTPDWSDIQQIGVQFTFNADDWDCWLDNFYISGSVIRGARQSAAYSSSDPCKMRLITDSVAKDDTINASGDSGTIARLTYAELLRGMSTPRVGTFTIPIANDLLPGQKVYLKYKKKSDGTFRKTEAYRVTQLVHNITEFGFTTTVEVTSDLTNANPRPMPTAVNIALQAVRPEFQDRQASSIKARDVDVTQAILEKSY